MKRRILMSLILMVYFSILSVYLDFVASNNYKFSPTIIIIASGVFLLIIALILIAISKIKPDVYQKLKTILIESDENFNGDKYVNELRNKITQSSTVKKDVKSTDILELMLDNMKEIRDYYVISKHQAKNAFSLSVSLCIIGFVLMIVSILFAVVLNYSLLITLIPAIGGAIAEVIAGTALIVYKASLSQLNSYYNSLHNNERFLSLVNLVSKVSNSKRDEAYLNIINIELENYRK